MAIGPVQLIVLGFSHPNFHGEVIEELERLHDSGTVRVIDALAVYKDADGELEAEHLSNLTEAEAIEVGSKIGALIGLGFEGEEGMAAGEAAGAEEWDVLADIPNDSAAALILLGASLGGAVAGCDRPRGRVPSGGWVHQPAGPGRDRADAGGGGEGTARPGNFRRRGHAVTRPRTPGKEED